MRLSRKGIFAGILLVASAIPATAQQNVCKVTNEDVRAPQPTEPDYVSEDASVDYYTLALSWSPQFCTSPAGKAPKNRFQCRKNSFGMVVHGLWPQSSGVHSTRDHPRNCAETAPMSVATVRKNLCLIPGVQLMQDEWTKHGACAFETPEEYLGQTAQLVDRLQQPDLEALADEKGDGLRVNDLVRAYTSANSGLPREGVQVVLDGKRRLRELRICYDLEFNFQACEGKAPQGSTRMVIPKRRAK